MVGAPAPVSEPNARSPTGTWDIRLQCNPHLPLSSLDVGRHPVINNETLARLRVLIRLALADFWVADDADGDALDRARFVRLEEAE